MRNVAAKVEKLMEICLSLNSDIAAQQKYMHEIEDKLSILNTLKEVNYYMGSELELKNILQIIIDVVMGVLGVSACSICLKNEEGWEIKEHSIMGNNSSIVNTDVIDKIKTELNNKDGEFVIYDLMESSFLGLNEGSFIALSLMRGSIDYGIITIYYNTTGVLNDGKKEFFRLIATQLGIHLENAYLYEKIKMASICDGLTGLYNRLSLNEIMHKDGAVNLTETSIIMIDIDNFKKVNDTYGHIFGDSVIKTLALILKNKEKKYGLKAFRYGGEEFLVLCENHMVTSVGNIAEEIRRDFSEFEFKAGDNSSIFFTISLGISNFGYSTKILDLAQLIGIADEALYFSKKTGKNRYTLSSSDLQLYLKSLDTINRGIARLKRYKSPLVLLKGVFDLRDGMTKTEFGEFTSNISRLFRVYDSIVFSCTGGFICILQEAVDIQNIKKRLNDALESYCYSNFNVEILECSDEPDLISFFKLS